MYFAELESPMPHAKVQDNQTSVFEEEEFKSFTTYSNNVYIHVHVYGPGAEADNDLGSNILYNHFYHFGHLLQVLSH